MSMRKGSWWLKSDSDPRWNTSGDAEMCGDFMMPPECRAAIKRLEQDLGEMPEDLRWGYMKG